MKKNARFFPPGKMFRAIHAVVRKIPRGKVMTYGSVARAAGYPGASRQVVWALRAGEALPWHRVVGAKGKILLPGEAGFEQRLRLRAEGVPVRDRGVEIALCEHRPAKSKRAIR